MSAAATKDLAAAFGEPMVTKAESLSLIERLLRDGDTQDTGLGGTLSRCATIEQQAQDFRAELEAKRQAIEDDSKLTGEGKADALEKLQGAMRKHLGALRAKLDSVSSSILGVERYDPLQQTLKAGAVDTFREVRSHLRMMSPEERQATINRAVAEGTTSVLGAVATSPQGINFVEGEAFDRVRDAYQRVIDPQQADRLEGLRKARNSASGWVALAATSLEALGRGKSPAAAKAYELGTVIEQGSIFIDPGKAVGSE